MTGSSEGKTLHLYKVTGGVHSSSSPYHGLRDPIIDSLLDMATGPSDVRRNAILKTICDFKDNARTLRSAGKSLMVQCPGLCGGGYLAKDFDEGEDGILYGKEFCRKCRKETSTDANTTDIKMEDTSTSSVQKECIVKQENTKKEREKERLALIQTFIDRVIPKDWTTEPTNDKPPRDDRCVYWYQHHCQETGLLPHRRNCRSPGQATTGPGPLGRWT